VKTEYAMMTLKRADQPVASGDGKRFLVERLWPRGVRKASLQIDGWLKEAAPSSELRQWFSHDPAKYPDFRHRYFRELDANPQAWQTILDVAARGGKVTLIYSSHDTEHNNAVALRDYLEKKLQKHGAELRNSA
jgi:uncharacterized protein YeaO (DUF488 family)